MVRNHARRSRKIKVALLVAVSLAPYVGCASMKPTGSWFSGASNSSSSSSSWTESIAGTGKGIGNQFKSMGTTMTSAVGKAKNAVVSTFSGKGDPTLDSQTSLADMPSSLGPEIWVTNGQVFEMKGNYAAALDNYTKALEKEPDNVPALQSVARLQLRQEQYPQAIETYQKVIRVNPSAENYSELATAQQKAGKLGEAQASLQKAISIDPSVPRYRNNLAGVLVSMGRSDEAIKELTNVFPPAVANYNVACLHFMNKNMAATQQHLQVALQIDPNLAKARELLQTLNQSQTGQTAIAAYDVANQVYRTAQGTPATQAAPTNAQTVSGTPISNNPVPNLQYSQLPQLPAINR